jgi:hypothetical protein
VAALNKKFTIVTLPTAGGKTFVIGLLYSYNKQILNKSVIVVVPSDELKKQMVDQLGRVGRGLTIMTRVDFFKLMPSCDLIIFDEIDEPVLYYPYEFKEKSSTLFNGIWDLAKYQVVGLTATSQGDV